MHNQHDDKLEHGTNDISKEIDNKQTKSEPLKCDKTMLEKLQEQMKLNQIK